jgi:iron(III) transport system ATP-binding protein
MTVRENIRFGLQVRRLSGAEQDQRIARVLDVVRMGQFSDRKPNQLSGGQQQRVALARALAVEPDCLLLDEPLSNLDAKLRQEMRSEIRRICKSQGVTTIYVTHDQKEAMSVADRIAVMNVGQIAQIGTPADLYHRPQTSFVAEFIGETNLLPGRIIARTNGNTRIQTAVGELVAAGAGEVSDEVTLSVRPELMRLAQSNASANGSINTLSGRVIESTFLGEASEHVLLVNGQRIKWISTPARYEFPPEVSVAFDPKDAVVLPRTA